MLWLNKVCFLLLLFFSVQLAVGSSVSEAGLTISEPFAEVPSVSPHQHKLGVGKKYENFGIGEFQQEARQKAELFDHFFLEYYPDLTGFGTKLSDWVSSPIVSFLDLEQLLEKALDLQRQGYPLAGFIFIVTEDHAMKIAPKTVLEGRDLGKAKHIALSEGKSVFVAGELATNPKESAEFVFSLASGTFMASLSGEQQLKLRQVFSEYLEEGLKLNNSKVNDFAYKLPFPAIIFDNTGVRFPG